MDLNRQVKFQFGKSILLIQAETIRYADRKKPGSGECINLIRVWDMLSTRKRQKRLFNTVTPDVALPFFVYS